MSGHDHSAKFTKAKRREIKLKTINNTHWKLPISYKIPFDKEGNLLFYPKKSFRFTKEGRYIENHRIYDWKDNFEFEDTLQYYSCDKGRESVVFNFKSLTTGYMYPMFLIDFLNLVKNFNLKKGMVKTNWTFMKVSQYFGVVPVKIKRSKKEYKKRTKTNDIQL